MYFLTLKKSDWFANGLQVYNKQTSEMTDGYVYIHGDHPYHTIDTLQEWPIDELDLTWNDLNQTRKATFTEKLKKLITKKEPNLDVTVHPTKDCVVIVEYDGGFLEVAEFKDYSKNFHWVTELYTGMPVKRWAYIPNRIVEISKNKKELYIF